MISYPTPDTGTKAANNVTEIPADPCSMWLHRQTKGRPERNV